MTKYKLLKNFIGVVSSNIITIISGVFVGFLVPKIFSVNDYGLYKTFTLYLSYIGFFSLGIIDGIVLKYGDKDYEEIEKVKFRTLFCWYLYIHIFFGVAMCVLSTFFFEKEMKYIGVTIAINMLIVNISGYFQQISQITQRFKEYSTRKILQSMLNVIMVGIFYVIFLFKHNIDYRVYIAAVLIINAIMTIWYIITYKDIIFGTKTKLLSTKNELVELIKIGFPLLFANLCTSLILNTDKQFVNLLFNTSDYAVYAFAYNMLSLVTVATSAVATILYPTLKRVTEEKLKDKYNMLITTMLSMIYVALTLYFPLSAFIKWFLPNYVDSLKIFKIIFPGLAISSCVTVIMHNYYKILGNNLKFFKKSFLILGISCIANAIAFYIFESTSAISGASVITMFIWYIYIEEDFVKKYGYRRNKNLIYILVSMTIFYIYSNIQNWIIGALVYAVSICFWTYCMQQKTLRIMLKELGILG